MKYVEIFLELQAQFWGYAIEIAGIQKDPSLTKRISQDFRTLCHDRIL